MCCGLQLALQAAVQRSFFQVETLVCTLCCGESPTIAVSVPQQTLSTAVITKKMQFILVLIALVSHFLVVCAQFDPGQTPQVCMQSCQQLLDLGASCIAEYSSSGNSSGSTACLCHGLPELDYSSCTSCLQTHSATVAQGLGQLSTFCTDFIKQCKYECDFPTCNSSDVACQCKETYLQDIYNCASCNSANGNTGATVLADYTALRDSCFHQGYSATPTGIDAVPTPSVTIVYTGQRPTTTSNGVSTGSTILISLSTSNPTGSGSSTQTRSSSPSSANSVSATDLNGGTVSMHRRLVGDVGLGQIFIALCLTDRKSVV